MADLWKGLSETVKNLAGTWTALIAVGSFGLYLLGYLVLRFHLTALGIGTDLNVLDERYLFAGAKFLVYLATSLPLVVLIVLVLAALIYLPYRILPTRFRTKVRDGGTSWWKRHSGSWSNPNRLALIGIILSVVMIQLVIRQCFFLSNLLLAKTLRGPGWLQVILLASSDELRALYFSGLMAGAAVTGGLFWLVRNMPQHTLMSWLMEGIFAALVLVHLLMLPVTYGILIADKVLPRVASLSGEPELEQGQEAWLTWEGSDWVTYLLRDRKNGRDTRMLITLRRSDVKKTAIIAYDPILRVLFAEDEKRAAPQRDSPPVFCP